MRSKPHSQPFSWHLLREKANTNWLSQSITSSSQSSSHSHLATASLSIF